MKNEKKFLCLMLALVLCLSLAACGGDGGGADGADAIPERIQDLVIDDSVECDYSDFLGTWAGEDGSTLIVEEYNGMRYELDDVNDDLVASGELQYVEEYGYVYAYNEHDGIAHRCWFDDTYTLHIDSFGVFEKTIPYTPDDTAGDGDFASLAGGWFLDGAADAVSSIEIDEYGNWTLYERPYGDGDPTMVDCGTISVNTMGEEGQYYAVSTQFDDVVYDLVVVEDGVMYWGGEYDCYWKLV